MEWKWISNSSNYKKAIFVRKLRRQINGSICCSRSDSWTLCWVSLLQQIEDSRLPRCTRNRVPNALCPWSLLASDGPAARPDSTTPLSNEPLAVGQRGMATFPDRCHCSIHHTEQMHAGGPVAHWPADTGIYICTTPGHHKPSCSVSLLMAKYPLFSEFNADSQAKKCKLTFAFLLHLKPQLECFFPLKPQLDI